MVAGEALHVGPAARHPRRNVCLVAGGPDVVSAPGAACAVGLVRLKRRCGGRGGRGDTAEWAERPNRWNASERKRR